MSLIGLDMYLKAEKYVSGWRHNEPDQTNEFERLVEMFGMDEFITDASPSAYVSFTVGYWRKANQIHSWFVRECQDGIDECQETSLTIEQLGELKRTCEFALGVRRGVGVNVGAADRVAKETLPPEEGFFFGTYEIDEWYWKDLEQTVAIVDKCIALSKLPGYWSFTYQSSW